MNPSYQQEGVDDPVIVGQSDSQHCKKRTPEHPAPGCRKKVKTQEAEDEEAGDTPFDSKDSVR